jgi:hypothetical protein
MLQLAGLALLLGLLVLELAIVKQAADGRVGVRGDLNEVQVLLASDIEGLKDGYDAESLTLGSDNKYFSGSDALVYSKLFSSYWGPLIRLNLLTGCRGSI